MKSLSEMVSQCIASIKEGRRYWRQRARSENAIAADADEEDDAPALAPPSSEAVVYRALCLGMLTTRRDMDQLAHEAASREGTDRVREAGEMVEGLAAWAKMFGVLEHLSGRENQLIGKPVGTWSQQEIVDGCWRTESLGVLLWALGKIDALPPYDTSFDFGIISHVPIFRETRAFVAAPQVRCPEELFRARRIAELWHWRSRNESLIREPERSPWPASDVEKVTATVAAKLYEEGTIAVPIDGDFPAFGKGYKRLSEDEYQLATSIAMERHFALNWLCGFSDNWDDRPTNT